MTEATLQARLVDALEAVVAEGSVIINDHQAPQVVSQARAPWIIIETADAVTMTTGESWTTPTVDYGLYVGLLTYRGGDDDAAHVGRFQTLRNAVLSVLATVAGVRGAASESPIAPYLREDGEPDPDSLWQQFRVDMTEYEV